MKAKSENFDAKIREHQLTANHLREEIAQLQRQISAKESAVLSVATDSELENIFSEIEEMCRQVRRKVLLARREDLQFWQETQSKFEFEIAATKQIWEGLIDEAPKAENTLKAAQESYDKLQNEIRNVSSRIAGLERSHQQAQSEANKIAAEKFEMAG